MCIRDRVNNGDRGIYVVEKTCTINDNYFYNNNIQHIYYKLWHEGHTGYISNNIFQNGSAIFATTGGYNLPGNINFNNNHLYDSSIEIHNLINYTINNNILVNSEISISGNSNGLFHNNTTHNNHINFYEEAGFEKETFNNVFLHSHINDWVPNQSFNNNFWNIINNTDIEFEQIVTTNNNGDPCDIYGNIFMDPLMEDYENNNYNLTIDSPLIDAGYDSLSDPDGSISDIGAFYFCLLYTSPSPRD